MIIPEGFRGHGSVVPCTRAQCMYKTYMHTTHIHIYAHNQIKLMFYCMCVHIEATLDTHAKKSICYYIILTYHRAVNNQFNNKIDIHTRAHTNAHTHTHARTHIHTHAQHFFLWPTMQSGEVSRETHHLTAMQDLSAHLGHFTALLPLCRFFRRARRSTSWTTAASPQPHAPCVWPTWPARSTSCRSPRPPSVCWKEVSWLRN